MGLPKGRTNNPNGRHAGVPNKITLEMKQRISTLFSENYHKIQADIDELEPKDRLDFLIKLLPYIIAKRAPENEAGESVPAVKIELAPGVDLGQLLGN